MLEFRDVTRRISNSWKPSIHSITILRILTDVFRQWLSLPTFRLYFESRKGPQSPYMCKSWMKCFGWWGQGWLAWGGRGFWRVGLRGRLGEQVRVVLTHLLLMSPLAVPQVAARTGETGVRRRTQAMSRSASKRRSRFSSLWGLDTTSKKKQGRPSINQVGSRVDEKASVDCFHGHLTLGCACVCIVPWLILLYHIN